LAPFGAHLEGPCFGKTPPHELYLRQKNYKINVNKPKFESKYMEKYSFFSQNLDFFLPKYKEYVIEKKKSHLCKILHTKERLNITCNANDLKHCHITSRNLLKI
jgi:hypothetical protein